MWRSWRWVAIPLGVLYLVFLVAQFGSVIASTYLDADTVSAPVIGQLFASAPAHATVVLGEFGWYATLLFELATKWLPLHRQVWEVTPYVMALAGAALAAYSVWEIAGRWAASLTLVLLICAAPDTLHLLLSLTQHGPDWFCLALLGASVVVLERRAAALRPALLAPAVLVVGAIVGVNAASDPLVVIAGLVPFVLALTAAWLLVREPDTLRALRLGVATLAVAAVAWIITAVAMAALNVIPEPGLNTTMFASAHKLAGNFRLWWQSIAVLGNGNFFATNLSLRSALALACAVLSIGAVLMLPRAGWRALRAHATAPAAATSPAPARLAFMVFWCSSASLLSLAFLLSATPVDIHADRYLVGLVYAAAAVIPVLATGRRLTELAALAGTCAVALSGVISMAHGTVTRNTEGFLSTGVIKEIARVAAKHGLTVGYAGYWDASPITWATHFRVRVYPVSVCDQNRRLCRFDLHFISSWYTPRRGIGSFLLTDPRRPNVPAPTPDLGIPTAVYHVGRATLYAYPYDLATKIVK
jgi:hypothetical protein